MSKTPGYSYMFVSFGFFSVNQGIKIVVYVGALSYFFLESCHERDSSKTVICLYAVNHTDLNLQPII